jgi:hypothetical protein
MPREAAVANIVESTQILRGYNSADFIGAETAGVKRPNQPIRRTNMKAKTILALVSLALGAALTSAVRATDLTPAETRAIAEEGFIYGLPIVMNYAVMYEYAVDRDSGQFKAPFNEIKNEPRVYSYKDTAIITPNSDTPYSFVWMDLRAEPMVLSVPAVEKSRYYSVMLCDGNTYNYGYIGSRATGNEAGDYLVVGPDWKGETPPGIKKVFRSTTQFSVAGYRTQLFNPDDMPNVIKIQATRSPSPPTQFPPVNAFWSVTMYDGKTQLPIENPISRYLINSPMLPGLKKNADGSMTLYIQKDNPGADKESNWLPAPNDLIYLVMRLYWPKTEAPSILPPGEGTWTPREYRW